MKFILKGIRSDAAVLFEYLGDDGIRLDGQTYELEQFISKPDNLFPWRPGWLVSVEDKDEGRVCTLVYPYAYGASFEDIVIETDSAQVLFDNRS